MRIFCQQTILMKYHTLFFQKSNKMLRNLSSAAVVIGALKVNKYLIHMRNMILHEGCRSASQSSETKETF